MNILHSLWAIKSGHLEPLAAAWNDMDRARIEAYIKGSYESAEDQQSFFFLFDDDDEDDKKPKLQVENGVATIPIKGPMMRQVPSWFAWYGIEATSTEEVTVLIEEAVERQDVQEIVFDMDSPGGTVNGSVELADFVAEVSRQMKTSSRVTDLCASACYWVASQTHEITANRTANIGSIGAYQVLVDSSKLYEDFGYKVHVISSGKFKGMGVEGSKITEAHIEEVQSMIDKTASMFVNSVAEGRTIDPAEVQKVADGRVFFADEAQELNLIDMIRTQKGDKMGKKATAKTEQTPVVQDSNDDVLIESHLTAMETRMAELEKQNQLLAQQNKGLQDQLANEAAERFSEKIEACINDAKAQGKVNGALSNLIREHCLSETTKEDNLEFCKNVLASIKEGHFVAVDQVMGTSSVDVPSGDDKAVNYTAQMKAMIDGGMSRIEALREIERQDPNYFKSESFKSRVTPINQRVEKDRQAKTLSRHINK